MDFPRLDLPPSWNSILQRKIHTQSPLAHFFILQNKFLGPTLEFYKLTSQIRCKLGSFGGATIMLEYH